ncbi:MAG: AhpC/TSA family protein [Chitinophagales bacterium]|nr:AhpC/TSA family protein [Chitinophagales bacterium]MDW8428780.1 TlpA disulfide reductase family protein [Chitinophagales bacterium]
MKHTLLTIAFVAVATSCTNSQSHAEFSISGKVRGLNSGFVYLEELTFSGRYPVDTARLDAQGSFIMKPPIKHKGLYQLKFDQAASVLLALDNKPFSIQLEADTASLRTFAYRLEGSPASEQLRRFLAMHRQLNEALQKAISAFQQQAQTNPAQISSLQQAIAKADSSLRHFARSYADTTANPVLALFAISVLDPDTEFATFERLEDRLKTSAESMPLAQSFYNMMTNQRNMAQGNPYAPKFKVGDLVPDIEMQDVHGKLIKLSSLRGKIVLLDFWASWCGPCRMENPNIVRAYEQYKNKGFTVFSVSLDVDRNRWIAAIEKDKLSWPYHVSELKGWQSPICQVYNIRSIPASYLLDRDGRVVAVNPRGSALEAALAQLLP